MNSVVAQETTAPTSASRTLTETTMFLGHNKVSKKHIQTVGFCDNILLLDPPGIIGSVSIIMTEVVGTNVLIFIMAMTVARNAVMRRKNIISEEALSEYLNLSYQPLANTQMIQSPPLTKPP